MPATDHLLKLLLSDYTVDFATWLLEANVAEAHPVDTELTSEAVAADHVSQVTLTDIRDPQTLLPQAIARIKTVSDEEQRRRLLTILVALLNSEEIIEMVEQLIEQDDLMLDTPFLRRIREEGRQEGRQEGREEGRAEGTITTLQRDILRTLIIRFELAGPEQAALQQRLAAISDVDRLDALLIAALKADSFESFQTSLASPDSPPEARGPSA